MNTAKKILAEKVIVITGASSGFGKGVARRFAEAKCSIVLAARRDELLEMLAQECTAAGRRSIACPTDVSKQEDVEALARTALNSFGCIDVWINNAGVGAIGQFEKIPLADHAQVIATDLLGTLYGSYFAYQYFTHRGSGILINVASELGYHSVPYYASYTAAKHGVVGLGESLNQELKQNDLKDIHVCTVMPTAHDTPFFDHAANYTGHEVRPPDPLHHPEHVIDTIFRLTENPRDKKIVGADGIVKIVLKNVTPGIADKMSGEQMHRTQMENSPVAPNTSGAVRRPMMQGTEVSAGRLKQASNSKHRSHATT